MNIGLGLIAAGLLVGLGLAGCTSDHLPQIPADIKTLAVDHQPLALAEGFAPDQYLASCFQSGNVVVFSSNQLAVQKSLNVKKGPSRLIRDPEHKLVYCLHTQENAVAILGKEPLEVQKILGTGSLSFTGGAIQTHQEKLWVCDGVFSVNLFRVPGFQLEKGLQVGRYPQNLAFSQDGDTVYVALKGENAVAVMNTRSEKVLSKIKVGIYPSQLLIHAHKLYVSNSGSQDISVVDLSSQQEKTRIRVREQPNSMVLLRNILWVSCEQSFRLVAIDIQQEKAIGSVKLGFYPGALLAAGNHALLVAAPHKNQIALVTPKIAE